MLLLIEKEKIQKAKEKLGERNADIIAEVLHLEKYDSNHHKALCPFHKEDTPSFVYMPKSYNYRCFGACGRNYDILDALMVSGMTYMQAVQKLFDLASMKYSFGEIGIQTKHSYRYPNPIYADNKNQVYDYWAKRGISAATIDYLSIAQDPRGNTLFQYYDTNDVLAVCKVRPSHKVQHGDCKIWYLKDENGIPYDTTPILYNMNKINVDAPLLICSGEGDCAAAIEAGWTNAVSICGGDANTNWVAECWDWIEQFDEIIICPDNDESGNKYAKEIIPRLGSWRCKIANVPEWFEKPDGQKVHVKDLNDCLFLMGKSVVMETILHAKDSPVDSVEDFSDIQSVDLDSIDGITSGIKALDRYLMKFFFGTFTIVTGINGSGKSSFLSNLICQCLEQDHNAFLYSGELPNFQSKNWINYILAGQHHIKEYHYKDSTYWKVTPEAQTKINDYYRGKLFIYKDGYTHKVSSLMKTMEDTVRKYGTKLLILDNLTSINLESNDNNKYDKQSEFVSSLIDFAKKFNVAIILVVHPHKIDTMRRLTKMDVQGISAVIDLAHRIISLYRVSDDDKRGEAKNNGKGFKKKPIPYDVLCDILKDRLMGFEGKSIGVYYDCPSRRFFTSEDDLGFNFKWDQEKHADGLPFPPEQLNKEREEDEVLGE